MVTLCVGTVHKLYRIPFFVLQTEAVKALVPTEGPMLFRDEMEDWTASEAAIFQEALEKYGKDFDSIRRDYLPWKSMKNIIE
jgi:hypothetical protein